MVVSQCFHNCGTVLPQRVIEGCGIVSRGRTALPGGWWRLEEERGIHHVLLCLNYPDLPSAHSMVSRVQPQIPHLVQLHEPLLQPVDLIAVD